MQRTWRIVTLKERPDLNRLYWFYQGDPDGWIAVWKDPSVNPRRLKNRHECVLPGGLKGVLTIKGMGGFFIFDDPGAKGGPGQWVEHFGSAAAILEALEARCDA